MKANAPFLLLCLLKRVVNKEFSIKVGYSFGQPIIMDLAGLHKLPYV